MTESKFIEKNLFVSPSQDYELVDSGEGEKLERFGAVLVRRPDPQALWKKSLAENEWSKASAQFVSNGKRGEWKTAGNMPANWKVKIGEVTLMLKLSNFKHTGVFPEQAPNWEWIKEKLQGKTASVLNLFGYTGAATIAAVKAGANVVHVDASKAAITSAKKNAIASGLGEEKVRWILDDALKFVQREVKRGSRYDAIIMDPPSFGRGPEGEVWKIEESLLKLVGLCTELLSEKPIFVILNGYSAGFSPIAYKNILSDMSDKFGGEVEYGEMSVRQSAGFDRSLPAGIFARWSSK